MFQSILNQNLYPIRETIIQKPKECFSFDECYQYFVCHYPQTELGADVLIMDYQQAINKNRYFEKNTRYLPMNYGYLRIMRVVMNGFCINKINKFYFMTMNKANIHRLMIL